MELGVQTSLWWMTLVKDLVGGSSTGEGGLRTVVPVCSVSWLGEEPCGSFGRGGLSRQKWPRVCCC